MTYFDPDHPYQNSDPQQPDSTPNPSETPVTISGTPPPIIGAEGSPPYGPYRSTLRPSPVDPFLPEDLRISWSWGHLIAFVFFGFASLLGIQAVLALYIASGHHWTQAQMEEQLLSDPNFIVGSNVLWFAMLLLFLYITLGVLRGLPFWRSLGWRKLQPPRGAESNYALVYLFSGCFLSLVVAAASSTVKSTGHMPIQELFKSRNGAMLLMAMAVLVAPLIEETVFRGYLYPLFANKFAWLANRFGMEPALAVRRGVTGSIMITGTLFGLLHGAQLGWTWGLVLLLILVGIVFTFVRARTGTVVASFLLHLGYNGAIAVTSIIATHGFREMPQLH